MNYEHLLNCNARAELARRNLLDFVEYVKPTYEANWHHKLLCEYLDKFSKGEIKRLMVFMPPQHGKSELVSRNLPAYLLGKNPKAKIVLASYSSYLSSSFNRDCQRIIDGKEYKEVFPGTKLNKSNVVSVSGSWLRNSEIFETVGEGGFLKAVGVGGSLTGTPADFAIIDDPVKDSLEAMSSTSQFRNWNWYTDVLYSRIHNNTSILITQTRWDVNDLSGKLLKQMESGGEKWVVLSLPAVKVDESSKEDHRNIGEALWPSKHSLEKLNIVRQQSIRTYEALYQQNPQPIQAGGEFWKQFNVTRHVRSITVASSTIHVSLDNNVNPYVTCSVWQVLGTQINQVHEIAAVDPYNNAVKAAHLLINWLRKINYKDVVFVYGDPSASAKSTVDENNASFFIKYIDELRKAGFKVTSRVGKSAPEIALSAAFINEIYEQGFNGYSISISDTCTLSIEDYYSVKEDKDGKMKKDKVKDVSTGVTFERYGHFSDAKRYFITELLKEEFSKYKNSTRQSLAGKSAYFR